MAVEIGAQTDVTRERGRFERITDQLSGTNGSLYDSFSRLSDVLVRLQGPTPTEAPQSAKEDATEPGSILARLDNTVDATAQRASELNNIAIELENLVR